MGTQLRCLIIIGALGGFFYIISMIRKEKLELKYSLSWMAAIISILIMGIIPESIEYISKILDIASPVNALFFVGICFILIILFSLTIAMSRNSKKVKDLVQKLALLEYKVEKEINHKKDNNNEELKENIG